MSKNLGLEKIQQMTIEKYYIYLINLYSKDIGRIYSNKTINNENFMPINFVDHMYTDIVKEKLKTNYIKWFNKKFQKLIEFNIIEFNYVVINNNLIKSIRANCIKIKQYNVKNLGQKDILIKKLKETKPYCEHKKVQYKKALKIQQEIKKINIDIDLENKNLNKLQERGKKLYISREKSLKNLFLFNEKLKSLTEIRIIKKISLKKKIIKINDNLANISLQMKKVNENISNLDIKLKNLSYNVVKLYNKLITLLERENNEKLSLNRIYFNKENEENFCNIFTIEWNKIDDQIKKVNENIQTLETEIKEMEEANIKLLNFEQMQILEECLCSISNKEAIKNFDKELISNVLIPLLKDLNEKFDKLYKYTLYLTLLLLTLHYGSKNNDNHISIDEAQDISINEYRILKIANNSCIFNFYGDTNQLIYLSRGLRNWNSLQKLFNADQYFLKENYRNTNQITDFCVNELDININKIGLNGKDVSLIYDINLLPIMNNCNECVIIVKNVNVLIKLEINLDLYNVITKKDDIVSSEKINIYTVEMCKGIEYKKVFAIEKDMTIQEKYISFTRALFDLIVLRI